MWRGVAYYMNSLVSGKKKIIWYEKGDENNIAMKWKEDWRICWGAKSCSEARTLIGCSLRPVAWLWPPQPLRLSLPGKGCYRSDFPTLTSFPTTSPPISHRIHYPSRFRIFRLGFLSSFLWLLLQSHHHSLLLPSHWFWFLLLYVSA